MLKTPIFGHFGQKGAIFEFSVKNENVTFYSFFLFFNTKNQKILIRWISGKLARTYGRTYGGEFKGPSTPPRDQKVMNGFRDISERMDGRGLNSRFLRINIRRTNYNYNNYTIIQI